MQALIADYQSGLTVDTICAAHGIGLSRLYRILDANHVPRRKTSQPKVPLGTQRSIMADYAEGTRVAAIAERHGVSTSTVSDVARRFWRHRQAVRERDELVDLIVRSVMANDSTEMT